MKKFKVKYFDDDDYIGSEVVEAESIVEAHKTMKDHAKAIGANKFSSTLDEVFTPSK